MFDWTEESVRSLTSRQVEESERSARERALEEEAEEEALLRSRRLWSMTESGLRRFLKGSWVSSSSSSELGSVRRRFFLSAIVR